MKADRLKAGNFYVGTWGQEKRKRCIFLHSGSLYSGQFYLDSNNIFGKGACCNGSDTIFREADIDEITWLKACMEQNRTVSFVEISIKSRPIQLYEIY